MGVREAWIIAWDHCNEKFGDSKVGQYFQVKQRKSTLTQEIRAGTVTFLTTAYILAVNALILSDTGGPCGPNDCTGPNKGQYACVYPDSMGNVDPGYDMCVARVKKSLVTATAASSLVGSLLMGAGANLPIACAPGMGLNAYFAYNVVGYRGSGTVTYQTALGAVFVEGWIFVILAVTGLRMRLIRLVPKSIMLATSAGIGVFLAFIGLQNNEGLGLIAYDPATLVSLGGCTARKQVFTYVIEDPSSVCSVSPFGQPVSNLPPASANFACDGGKMQSGSMWLGVAGLMLVGILMSRSYKGSIIIGIAFVTIIAWIPGHGASYLGASSAMPGGAERLGYFKRVVDAPTLRATGGVISFKGFTSGELWIALITFLWVDFLDTTGTLFSMANFINNYVPGFVNEHKQFPRQTFAFCVDGLSSVVGSLMGTSPIAAFIESASGIREGGRTGITAICVAVWYFVALFFTPVLASVPPYAVGPALITVGALMMMNVVRIKWEQSAEALPAFLTIVLMPLTYSIAYGIIGGLLSYCFLNGANWLLDKASELLHTPIAGTDAQPNLTVTRSFIGRIASNTGGAQQGGRVSASNMVRAMAGVADNLRKASGAGPSSMPADTPMGVTPPISRISSMQDAKALELQGKASGLEAREALNGRPPLRPPASAVAASRNGPPVKGDERV